MRRPRGRAIVALGLLGFLLLTSGVVWRRSVGIARARELRELEVRRQQLEAERVRLENDIREASGRARLGAVAERRLGMRLPDDSQVVILPKPRRDGTP